MLNEIREILASSTALQLLADTALRSAVVLTVATVVLFVLRRASSATRHLGWSAAVTLVVLMPVISVIAPDWHILPSVASAPRANVNDVVMPPVLAAPTISVPATVIVGSPKAEPAGSVARAESTLPRPTHLRADQIVLFTWASGVVLVLAAIALGFLRVALISRRTRRITDGVMLSHIAEVAVEFDVSAVRALESDDTAMPMTWGILRPTLLLPSSARHWSATRLQAVLRHELAHIRRRDSMWQLLAELACALHWFNPLAWYAARRMRIEREHACDDAVLNAGSRASDYASELLEIARSLRSARATSLAAIAMAQPSQLEGRLLAVLDDDRARKNPAHQWPAWFAAVIIAGPIATATSKLPAAEARSERTANTEASATALTFAPPTGTSSNTRMESLAVAAGVQGRTPCASDNGHFSVSSTNKDGYYDMKWETGRCKGRLTIRGRIRLRGDLTGIESLSSDGDFKLSVKEGRETRVVAARPSGRGIAYEFTVDGDKRSWNTEGQAWLASILTYVVRSTGFGADERVAYLLKHQGYAGVLAEVEIMQSDYVQRLYLAKLMEQAQLNGGAVENLLATAKRALQSDYEMAELLIAVSKRYDFTEGVRRAFIDATTTLQSDYEHRRALSAVLKKGGLNSENVVAMLASSKEIQSDYEMAELLVDVANTYKLDPTMRSAYLASATNLNSDYERGRVYKTLLRQNPPNASETAELLDAVARMASDYERSEVLQLIPPAALSNVRAQEAYVKVIGNMSSDYETRRAMTALMNAGPLAPGVIDLMLNVSLRMQSDYERAELLLAILKANKLTPEQQSRVGKATNAFRSDYERGRVATALVRQMN